MEFDEMKIIWDSQKNEPMYAIDHPTLLKRVRNKADCIAREVNIEEWSIVAVALLVSGVFAYGAYANEGKQYAFISAAVFAGVAVYQLATRARRRRNEVNYDESVLGNIDRALARMDYLIRRSRTFIWWFLAPALFVLVLGQWFRGGDDWIETAVAVFLCLPLSYAVARWGLRKRLLPRRKQLQRMRALLTESEGEA